MPDVIYSMTVSLDGFIAGPDGEIDWSSPDDELHRFHNDRVARTGTQFCGRGLYETMTYWDTAEADPSLSPTGREFAAIWRQLPKVVFSRTLAAVAGNARLARDGVAAEVARCREASDGDLAVGGAGLAAAFIELGLVDEFRLFVTPVVLGGGTAYFPRLSARIALELAETRRFGSRVVYLRYRRV